MSNSILMPVPVVNFAFNFNLRPSNPDHCALFLRLVTPATDVKVSYRFNLVGSGGAGDGGGRGGGGSQGQGGSGGATPVPVVVTDVQSLNGNGDRFARASAPAGPSGGGDGGGYARAADARRFNTQDAGAKVSWGFPTFIRRDEVGRMGLLSGGRAQHVEPMKPALKALGTMLVKIRFDEPLSNFAFNFNLRRYMAARWSFACRWQGLTLVHFSAHRGV